MKAPEIAANALWSDVQDWLISKNHKEIENFYSRLFSEYLTEKFGRLSPSARQSMIKALMKQVIQ